MEVNVVSDGNRSAIYLSGRFDSSGQQVFFAAVDEATAANAPEIRVDLGGVDYIDSTALGLLLMVRERATGAGKRVVLAGAQGSVKLVLDISNFAKIFGMA